MLKEYLSTLANRFRIILGTTKPINAQDFEGEIENVFSKGHSTGLIIGRQEGLEQGIEQGKQAEYDRFWNLYQPNGNDVTDYGGAFSGPRWTTDTFTPKYDIVPSNAQNMFWNSAITDLVAACERQGIKLDFSQNSSSGWGSTFTFSKLTRIGELSANGASLSATFSYSSCHTIDKIIVSDGTAYSSTFINCSNLRNITFEGVIGQNSLNFQWSPNLTIESLRSIISCLKDYSTDTSGTQWVVTVGSTNLAKLTDTDLAKIAAKGWNFV